MWKELKRAPLWAKGMLGFGVGLLILIAAIPSEESEEGEKAKPPETTTQTATTKTVEPPKLPLIVNAPSVAHSKSIGIDGKSAPRARISVGDKSQKRDTKASKSGRFSVRVRLNMGQNNLMVVGESPGFVPNTKEFSITRKRTAAERAAIRERKRQARAQREANYKASAKTIPYKQLEKNPERYAGKRVTYRGQIFQIQEDAGSTFLLLSVTDQGYDIWTDNIWVDYDDTISSAEDDVITIWGEVIGTQSYGTQAGGQTYVPQVEAKYIAE